MIHKAKPGRRAFTCDHKDHKGTPIRVFVTPREDPPRCAQHGAMKPQVNRPYRGEQIPDQTIVASMAA